MTRHGNQPIGLPRARGLSLIELMVALTIGLLLIIGAITVYSQSRNTFRVNDDIARIQETARYAMDVVEPDLRMAGYFGFNNRVEYLTNTAQVNQTATPAGLEDYTDEINAACGTNFSVLMSVPLEGINDTSGIKLRSGPNLTCAPLSAVTNPDWRDGSDVVVVRRASSEPTALAAGRLQLQSSRLQATLFANGALPTGYAPPATTETFDAVVNAYYVGENSTGRPGLPSLRRKRLVDGPAIRDEEIAPGVEDFQVQFGIDTTGDQDADSFVNPGAEGNNQIVAVRIWMMVRALERDPQVIVPETWTYAGKTVTAPDDNIRRILFEKTVQLRNNRR